MVTKMPPRRTDRASGFTLIELLVVLAIVATLLALVAPHYLGSVDRAREQVLKENLATLRSTIDKFHADTGHYPASLHELVTRRYLRTVPEDPVTQDSSWVLVAPPEGEGEGVADVRSSAPGQAHNGTPYAQW